MNSIISLDRKVCQLTLAIMLSIPAVFGANDSPLGFEMVGQVMNLSPTQSLQYGYLNRVAGLDSVSTAGAVSEGTAIFTFYNDTTTQQVINNGPIRVIDRTGTSTIYVNPTGGAHFLTPDSFRSGKPIQTCQLRHQVIIDTSTGYFTTTFEMTVKSSQLFQITGSTYLLGIPGKTYTWNVYGKLNSQGLPSAHIAGSASGIQIQLIEKQ